MAQKLLSPSLAPHFQISVHMQIDNGPTSPMDGVPFSLINCPHTNMVCVPLYVLVTWPVIYFTPQVGTEESNKPGNERPPF